MLLDIGLPGMDGYELAATLRREDWSQDSVVIAVSGYGEEQARDRSKAAGFNHHLVKPVNFDTILALLGGPETARGPSPSPGPGAETPEARPR